MIKFINYFMLSKIGEIKKYFYVFNRSKCLIKMLNKTCWFVFVNLSLYVYYTRTYS